jgi:hypothetical protein
MTLINCVSGALYTKGFAVRDKVQVYGTALVFLVLLYNSPAGLVLYWTMNNLFSLAKNILVKTKYAKKVIYGILFTAAALLDGYVLFFHPGDLPNRLLAFAIFSSVFLIPLLGKIPALVSRTVGSRGSISDVSSQHSFFILSLLILLTLTGFIVPASLIASSVEEFSFIEAYTSPFPFIRHTLLQAAGLFLFWPLCIYFLFSNRTRRILSFCITVLAFGAFINVFLANENFGFLTNTLIFSEPKSLAAGSMKAYLINIALLAVASAVILYMMLKGKKIALFSFQVIALTSLLFFGIFSSVKIYGEYTALMDRRELTTDGADSVYTLSKTGKNVLLIMLDAAVSGYVPYIFEEKPELAFSLRDFTWYPNCVSFASHTLIGAPPIYGGYEYTPEAINRRVSIPLVEKHREAYLLLPRIF